MEKMIYIDAREIEFYQKEVSELRKNMEESRKKIISLTNEINFLKDSGEEILVIEKSDNDIFEYKSTEKELLTKLVSENKEVRDKYDDVLRYKDNLENQKQIILLKYQELENNYKNDIEKLNKYISFLENRSLTGRIINTTKDVTPTLKIEQSITTIADDPIQIIYSKEDMLRLESEARAVKKPRGWHFKEEYIDSVGNVYHKGKLQPHLKKKIT
jgi:hypothetical protein